MPPASAVKHFTTLSASRPAPSGLSSGLPTCAVLNRSLHRTFQLPRPLSTTSHVPLSRRPSNRHDFYSRGLHQSIGRRTEATGTDSESTETETTPEVRYKHISVDRSWLPNNSGRLVTVTIRNPTKLNILSSGTIDELHIAFASFHAESQIRAVILTGETDAPHTPSFCAGANIREMGSIQTSDEAEAFITRVSKLCDLVYALPAVTIARIHGLCFGAGLEVAASCDFRYGTEGSTFSMKEVAVGIPSVIHARLLANIMGWQAAKRMILLANVMKADEAHQSNLLDAKFSTVEEMDSQIQEDVHIVASYGQKAMRVQKELLTLWERSTQTVGITSSIASFGKMWEDGGSEPKKFMNAWIERSRDKKPK